jgi:hypothetical protein
VVEGINTEAGEWDEERMRAAVLAILRGDTANPRLTEPKLVEERGDA